MKVVTTSVLPPLCTVKVVTPSLLSSRRTGKKSKQEYGTAALACAMGYIQMYQHQQRTPTTMDAWLLGILRFSVTSVALWSDPEVQTSWEQQLERDVAATPGHRVHPGKGVQGGQPNPWKVTPGTLTKYLNEISTIHNERCGNKLYFFSAARNPTFTRESNKATHRCEFEAASNLP